jgi:hypothetical protein
MRRFFRSSTNSGSSNDSAGGGKNNNKGSAGARSIDGRTTVFRVTVPDNAQPGQEFQVYAGNRIVRVRCPTNVEPGQSLQITVPVEPQDTRNVHDGPPDSPNARRLDDGAYMVTVPSNVRGGQQFPVTMAGQTLMVTAPANAEPGTEVRVMPPPPAKNISVPPQGPAGQPREQRRPTEGPASGANTDDEPTQLFEVKVPPGVKPGRPFALLAGGARVLVTCPRNASPGQRIRFKVPKALTEKRGPSSEAAAIKLSYDKDGWTRTIRVSDMMFQWVRMDDKGDVDTSTEFNTEKSAYVRKLDFRSGGDALLRDADISFVPASQAFVDSKVRGNNGEVLVTYSEIADAQVKDFEDKARWFQEKCHGLSVEWNEGHMRINVRREHLLEDSVDAVMSLSRRDMRKLWRFEFIGEAGIDAGGLAREWFQLVTEEIFDPDMGLWKSSEANQMMMTINPASGTCFCLASRFLLLLILADWFWL